MGGAWFHRIDGSLGAVTQEDLLSRATEAVRDHLDVTAAPIWSHVEIQKVGRRCVGACWGSDCGSSVIRTVLTTGCFVRIVFLSIMKDTLRKWVSKYVNLSPVNSSKMDNAAIIRCLCLSESMRSFIKKENLPLSLIGSSYDGVSVNDVIFSGRTAAEELLGAKV